MGYVEELFNIGRDLLAALGARDLSLRHSLISNFLLFWFFRLCRESTTEIFKELINIV